MAKDKNPPAQEVEEVEDEEPAQTKIDKWDHRQAKNAIDDNVKEAVRLTLNDCDECFTLVDTRLWLAFVSCLLCGACCLYDYMNPYPKSHYFMISCLVPYGIIVAYLTYFMMYVEGNIIITMVGEDQKYHVSSAMGRFNGEYKLTISRNGNAIDDEFCIGKVITEDNQVCEDAVGDIVEALVKRCDDHKFEPKKTK